MVSVRPPDGVSISAYQPALGIPHDLKIAQMEKFNSSSLHKTYINRLIFRSFMKA
jgi:hypothetical protein